VTINVAEHFHLDHVIGCLAPGRMADIVIIPSPRQFSPQMVMCAGKIIFNDGRVLVEPKKAFFPEHLFDTVKIGGYRLPPIPRRGRVRVMELVSGLVTKERIIGLDNPEEMKDVLMLLALDRVGGKRVFHGLLKGFGLQKGAYGSTACWDTIDLIAVGCDLQSMRTVIERLKEIRGGMVYVIGDKVVAESSAPLVGVMSLKPMESLREEIRKVEDSLRRNGAKWEKPTLTIDTLTSPAIPHLRITHEGYVRLRDREVLSLEVEP
jgi:adenine deaminase